MADHKQPAPSKRTKAAHGKKSQATANVQTARSWFFRPSALVAASFAFSLLVLGPFFHAMLPNLSERPEYQLSLDQIQVNVPPEWVPETFLEEALQASGLPQVVSLLDRDLSRKVGEAVERHPWVRRVQAVQITGEPAIRVTIEYRQPVAFVETARGYYPIDVDGGVLPSLDFSLSDMGRLPLIRNIASQPGGEAGSPWNDTVVCSAAKLATVLAPEGDMQRYWRRFRLQAIIAPAVATDTATPRELTFELATDGGSRIIWGKPPGADDLEPTVEQKLGRLEQYLSRFGDFDSPNGPYRIDIRLFDAISLEPLKQLNYR